MSQTADGKAREPRDRRARADRRERSLTTWAFRTKAAPPLFDGRPQQAEETGDEHRVLVRQPICHDVVAGGGARAADSSCTALALVRLAGRRVFGKWAALDIIVPSLSARASAGR